MLFQELQFSGPFCAFSTFDLIFLLNFPPFSYNFTDVSHNTNVICKFWKFLMKNLRYLTKNEDIRIIRISADFSDFSGSRLNCKLLRKYLQWKGNSPEGTWSFSTFKLKILGITKALTQDFGILNKEIFETIKNESLICSRWSLSHQGLSKWSTSTKTSLTLKIT